MAYPIHRGRRLRRTDALRSLVRETRLTPDQLVMPLFVCPGTGIKREIGAMPGNFQLSVDTGSRRKKIRSEAARTPRTGSSRPPSKPSSAEPPR